MRRDEGGGWMVTTGVGSYIIPHGNGADLVRGYHRGVRGIDPCDQATCSHKSTPMSDWKGVHPCSGVCVCVCVDTAALRGVFWRVKQCQPSIFSLKFSPSTPPPPPCVTLARCCRHSHIGALGDGGRQFGVAAGEAQVHVQRRNVGKNSVQGSFSASRRMST